MADPAKYAYSSYLQRRIDKINEQLKHGRHPTTMRDLKVEKKTLESVKEWIEK